MHGCVHVCVHACVRVRVCVVALCLFYSVFTVVSGLLVFFLHYPVWNMRTKRNQGIQHVLL